MAGIISVVIGGHFGGGDHFDGGDHFGGGNGPCFTLYIVKFCLYLCLAKDNERLWHYHRI